MKIRLLHVDDEPDLAELVGIALSLDDRFETRSCESGTEAFHIIAEWKPDILLLDYMLPGLDGPSVLEKLKGKGDTPRTIFLTARTSGEDIKRLTDAGAIGVIRKPFDPMNLAVQIAQMAGHE